MFYSFLQFVFPIASSKKIVIPLTLFHLYFLAGIVFFQWKADILLWGYFLDAILLFPFYAGLMIKEQTLSSFPMRGRFITGIIFAVIQILIFFILIIILDSVFSPSYRADTLINKIILTSSSMIDHGPLTEDAFFITSFTRKMRNEFLIQTALILILSLMKNIILYFSDNGSVTLMFSYKRNVFQFWFILLLSIVSLSLIAHSISLPVIILASKVIFDRVCLDLKEESIDSGTKRIKNILYMILLLCVAILYLSSKAAFAVKINFILIYILISSYLIYDSPAAHSGYGNFFKQIPNIFLNAEGFLWIAGIIICLILFIFPDAGIIIQKSLPQQSHSNSDFNYDHPNLCRESAKECKEILKVSIHQCRNGSIQDCFYTGYTYEMGKIEQRNVDHAKQFYRIACTENHGAACFHLAKLLQNEMKPEDSSAGWEIDELLKKSCRLNFKESCIH